jgi:glycogen debranching enzyme
VTADALLDEGRARAEELLLANASELGLMAASRSYRQVWARDSMIGGLALMVLADAARGRAIHHQSIATLARFQSRLGNLPHNVGFAGVKDPALIAEGGVLEGATVDGVVIDTAHAGCIDNALWFIVGNDYATALDGDTARLERTWPAIERAYRWLEHQDVNECGLLEAHEAMDWADLFSNRYNTLFANVLWFGVQRSMARMTRALGRSAEETTSFAERAEDVRFKLTTLLWVGPEGTRDLAWVQRHRQEWLYPIRRTETELQERPFFLPFMAFRDYADRFDTFGNLLAIVLGLATDAQASRILDYIAVSGLADPWPIRVLYPAIQPGDRDWRDYFRVRNLNLPHHYHNGGIWPMVGGFYVAALVRAGRADVARAELEKLARINHASRFGAPWEFNEWVHGASGKPAGFPGQSWSAAMYVYAHECVRRGACPGWPA